MDKLLWLDKSIFLIINHMPHTPLSDAMALALSGLGYLGIIWVIQGLWLFFREEERDHWFALPFLLAIVLSCVVAEIILKPIVSRPRPTLAMGAIIIDPVFFSYSFPSSHATIAFAAAYILSKKEPLLRIVFFAIAGMVGVSRVFLGKHYPSDVIVGAILGMGIGWVVSTLAGVCRSQLGRQKAKNDIIETYVENERTRTSNKATRRRRRKITT